jgi:geranylgeranyl reductase family protein
MKNLTTDIVIIGAGPAGCSASIYLSKFKIPHVILEKDVFPRDKICGDALSGKVVSQLKRIDPRWVDELSSNAIATPSWGVVFSSPNGNSVEIPFRHKPNEAAHSPGFISKRINFDNFLFNKLDRNYATVLQNEEVKDVEITNENSLVTSLNYSITAKLVISAEGVRGLVAKKFAKHTLEPKHHCAGLRAYYKGVKGLHPQGFIELHFVKEALPGYFWIFPLPDGRANVGIGMLSQYISKKKVNLKKLMEEVLESKQFKARFENAELEGKILGLGLPLGSKKRTLSGNRFMLTGDSGSLIDPFTGEGIGNAMYSGKWAAEQAEKCIAANNYSATFLQVYDKHVYKKLGKEFQVSHLMQKLILFPRAFNWMIAKIKRNKELRQTITFMFDNVDLRKKFRSPLFYLRVLFG